MSNVNSLVWTCCWVGRLWIYILSWFPINLSCSSEGVQFYTEYHLSEAILVYSGVIFSLQLDPKLLKGQGDYCIWANINLSMVTRKHTATYGLVVWKWLFFSITSVYLNVTMIMRMISFWNNERYYINTIYPTQIVVFISLHFIRIHFYFHQIWTEGFVEII